jgi:transposase
MMPPFEETPTKRKRRTFEPSFTLEIVNTIKNQGLSVSKVAKGIHLTESTVLRWVQQVDEKLTGRPGKGLPLTPDQQRVRPLEA